jgi:hypothetical protein
MTINLQDVAVVVFVLNGHVGSPCFGGDVKIPLYFFYVDAKSKTCCDSFKKFDGIR